MAVGDFTPKKLLQKALTTTATESQITGAVNTRTTVTSITYANTNTTTTRSVTPYIYGTTATNRLPLASYPANSGDILTGLDYVLLAGETMSFAQDSGTDVTVTIMGIEEVVS